MGEKRLSTAYVKWSSAVVFSIFPFKELLVFFGGPFYR